MIAKITSPTPKEAFDHFIVFLISAGSFSLSGIMNSDSLAAVSAGVTFVNAVPITIATTLSTIPTTLGSSQTGRDTPPDTRI